jgi:Fe-S-cluster containining protein
MELPMPSQNSQEIEPIELTPEIHFRFRCHPGVSCFNQCCAQTTIILSPYDVLRLKRRLNLTAGEFLQSYTDQSIDDFSGLPLVVLRMAGENKLCLFSTEAGCGVYEDRPATCRYYPVGVGSQWTEKGLENCYVYIQEEHCQGFQEEGDWTLQTWCQDQGLETYVEMDREWKSIMLQVGARTGKPVSAKFQDHYYQGAYNLDWFKGYIFDTDFLKVFEVEPELLERLRTDEEELLRFAFRYLKYMLRLESTLTVKMPRGCPGQPCSPGEK